MSKPVINLYTKANCGKCSTIKKLCEKSDKIKNSDFQIITIDMSDDNDVNMMLLEEHNICTLPVLLINNDFISDFNEIINYIRN